MPKSTKVLPILVADDDPDDRLLIQSAFEEGNIGNPLIFVEDGEELLDYLCHQGRFALQHDVVLPGIILLDLNMPRKNGRQVLRELKSNPEFRRIPIIILTTSALPDDIAECYEAGANGFICKPATFEKLTEALKIVEQYWFNVVVLSPS